MKPIVLAAMLALAASPALAQNAAQVAKAEGGASCPRCNLFQANLSNKTLRGRHYEGARLRQADLSVSVFDHGSFAHADLRDVNGYGGRFTGTNFTDADMTNSTFVGAYLEGANFSGAKLSGVNFAGAEMDTAIGLSRAQLREACGDDSTKLPKGLKLPACK
jgi:uncharacterized protein YjbI with pentapeptide repeats